MLTEQDKKAIDACVTSPNSVWEGIKSIITAEKYTWYLESLAQVRIMPNIAERKAKWDAMDASMRNKYMETDAYDEDLNKVLQQVAAVLGDIDPEEFPIGSFIGNWRKTKTKTILRQTAFKVAVAFRFTKDETKQLLFTVLEENEQMDFNPRLPNEMIYAYAIICGVPQTLNSKKSDEKEVSYESLQGMFYEAQQKYLVNLFGNSDSKYFDDLILVAEDSFNLLDSLNMTRSAFSLAIIKYVHENVISVENAKLILKAFMDDAVFSTKGIAELFAIIIEKNKFSEDNIKNVLTTLVIEGTIKYQNTASVFAEMLEKKKMLSQDGAALLFAPYNGKRKKKVILTLDDAEKHLTSLVENHVLSHQDAENLLNHLHESGLGYKENDGSQRTLIPDNSITQSLYENTYGSDIFEPIHTPDFGTATRDRGAYLTMFRLAERYLNAAIEKAIKTDTVLYKRLLDFVTDAQNFVNNTQKSTLSPIDFLPLIGCSGFGDNNEVYSAIRNILISKFIEEAKPRTENEDEDNEKDNVEIESGRPKKQKRTSNYHVTSLDQIISKEQGWYFVFFWEMMIEGIKHLRAFTERKILFFWYVYTEMNRILMYPYYDPNGICMRVITHYKDKRKIITHNDSKSKNGGVSECDEKLYDVYTYTLEKIEYFIEDAEYGVSPSELISGLVEDVHCYEYFNQVFISHGKNKFVEKLHDEGVLESLGVTGNDQPDYLRTFYSEKIFSKQYLDRSIPYKRKDILKLAFWNWVNKADNLKKKKLSRKRAFMTYFDKLVKEYRMCCAESNTNNSLDNFLLLCLEADEPIGFLKEAIGYSKKLESIF